MSVNVPVVNTVAAAAPKMKLINRIGQIIGKILKFTATHAAPIADQASAVVSILLPQFAPEIAFADSLVTKIAKQCIVTEAIATSASAATTGAAKLSTVVAGIGPELDAWVAAAFPGAHAVSAASKAGLVQAVYNIVNEQDGTV